MERSLLPRPADPGLFDRVHLVHGTAADVHLDRFGIADIGLGRIAGRFIDALGLEANGLKVSADLSRFLSR